MSMAKTMELSKRLKAYHARRHYDTGEDISQYELAEEFGVERGLFNKHYNGTRTPADPITVAKYAAVLGDDLFEILGVRQPTREDYIIDTLEELRSRDDTAAVETIDSIHDLLADRGLLRTKKVG